MVLGPARTQTPFGLLQFAPGVLLVLFGMRWLRKALLRAAGVIPQHDEMGRLREGGRVAAQAAARREPGRGGGRFPVTTLERA